ncbi:MDR family MFS transporter [Bifidobacterium mongoliense]|uniref:MDR family MFS transporter n=1 Tax=Bifidobacterium mongoliense TaxID=518643 RepID=UPI0030EBDC7C
MAGRGIDRISADSGTTANTTDTKTNPEHRPIHDADDSTSGDAPSPATSARPRSTKRDFSAVLPKNEAYVDGHLSKPALISIAILTFITFVGNFTQLQLSAALPTIVKEFDISVTTGQWLTSIIMLTMGVMVPLTAFLTRRFSTRQIVITSMVVFTLGSIIAWLGPTFPIVLAGRGLEAIGSGVMWPVLQITVFSIYPLARRGLAMGTVGMAMSVAPAIGPVFGGWQTDANGWRSVFLTLAVIGVIALLLATFGLRNFVQHDGSVKADLFSVCLSIIGFGSVMFGVTNSEAYGFGNVMVWLPIIVGIAGIIWFVLRQIHRARLFRIASEKVFAAKRAGASPEVIAHLKAAKVQPPLLDLSVLRNHSFTVGTITATLSFFAFSTITVIIPLYIQNDRGFSATMSGLVMLPGALGQCIAQFGGGRLLDRFGARPVTLVGSITLLVGTLMMAMIGPDTWIWWVSICQFIRQIGMGFVLMPVTTWSLNCLRSTSVSAGSAVTNTSRQLGGAIGAPILVIAMESITKLRQSALGGGVAHAVAASIFGVRMSLYISALITFAMVVLVFFGVKGDGAGSTRDLTHQALHRLHEQIEQERNHITGAWPTHID